MTKDEMYSVKERFLSECKNIPNAEEMFDTFIENGGLHCVIRWPEQFSFFYEGENMLDKLMNWQMA